MGLAAGDLHYIYTGEALYHLGLVSVGVVAVAQLAVLALAPGPDLSIIVDRQRVVRAAGDVAKVDTLQLSWRQLQVLLHEPARDKGVVA